jgi:hypothetical protein
MARFARLGAQQAQELGQNNTATCSMRPSNARACPGARPRARRAAPSQTCAHARARTYKANRGLDRTPPLALNLAGATTFLHFSPFGFFCTIMPFVVSFQKMDPNLDVVIIGAEVTHSGADIISANFSYVAADVASIRGSTS